MELNKIPDSSIVDTSTEESFREENTDQQGEPEASSEHEAEPEEESYSQEQDQDSRQEQEDQDSRQEQEDQDSRDQNQDYPEQSQDSYQEQRFQEQEESNQDQYFGQESSDQFQNQSASEQDREPFAQRIEEDSSDQAQTGFTYQQEDSQSQESQSQEEKQTQEERQAHEEPVGKQDAMEESQDNMDNVRVKEEPHLDEFKQQNFEEKPNVEEYQGYDVKKESYEADVKMEQGAEVKEERAEGQQDDRKRKRSRWSPQPDKEKQDKDRQGWGQSAGWSRKEDEPELDNNAMVLGWYDSDLNLEINRTDFLEASPMSSQGFGYIWAGCRATFGFNQGKVCYEVKLLENHDVTHLEDEPSPHVLRVGWSTLKCSMLLGEEPQSYGYGGTAKASTNLKFTNYGVTYGVGDTVTCYLEYGEMITISYACNGNHLGDAFSFPATDIDNQPLFPHMLTKNIKFKANFGPETEFPIQEGYTWASQVPEEMRVSGPRRPETRGECEMLMMCGLPGCGKTTWANAYVAENPDKFYNILGTNNLIDKMKIQGLPRKRNYHGRWDVLIDKCTKCLNKLLEMAAKRRRNYILDQTNVYPSAQKRKMRNFGGFVRRAIVIVPPDEEFQRRVAKREAEEGKDIPDSAVLEMKANFRLPEAGEHFDEVRYIELNEEESRPLVEQYNKEGRDAGYGQQQQISGQAKKFRPDRPQFGRGGGGGGGFRGGRGRKPDVFLGFGGGMDRHDRGGDRRGGGFRSGGMDRGGRGGGGWGGRGGDRGPRGGGWRDRSPAGRDMDGRPPGGGPWRNNRNNDRDRPYDRNQRGRGGPRGGGFDRDMFRQKTNSRDDDFGRGYGRDMDFGRGGYDRDDFRGGGGFDRGFNGRDDGGFGRDGGRGGRGGRGGGGRGGFDRDRGGGRGGFDRNRGGGGGFNDRRGGGGNRQGGFDRGNRGGGSDRGGRDSKGGNMQDGQNQQGGWGNQGYNQGWGQGYNQQGYNQGFNQGYNQQQPQQQGWGNQQGWAGYGAANATQQQQQPAQQQGTGATPQVAAAGVAATPAAAAYSTTTPAAAYGQQGYNQATAQQYAQGYWGQYGYGQGWTQNADGTYSYPQGWQQYGYGQQYAQPAAAGTMAAGATPAAGGTAAVAATPVAAPK